MKNKIRLFLGQSLDTPFANSVPVMVVLAVLFAAASVLLWSDAGDTLFLKRENASVCELTVESAAVAGQDSYVPRVEITADDGQVYTLLKSQVGDVLEDVAAKLESGDQVTLRLSRKGSILEIAEGDEVHLAFDESIGKAVGDVIVSAITAVVFDLLAIFLLLRAWVLKLNRKGSFRFGPAR